VIKISYYKDRPSFFTKFQPECLRAAGKEIEQFRTSELKILKDELNTFKKTFKPLRPIAELAVPGYLFDSKMNEMMIKWVDTWYTNFETMTQVLLINSFPEIETILLEKELPGYLRILLILISRKEAIRGLRRDITEIIEDDVNLHKIASTSGNKNNPGIYKDTQVVKIEIPVADYKVRVEASFFSTIDFVPGIVKMKSQVVLTVETRKVPLKRKKGVRKGDTKA